jgi:hypothetical protein
VVVSKGKSQTVSVTLGLVGATSTQVKSGLTAGEKVELADPNTKLPSSTTSSSTTRFGGGAFPAGGFAGGGFGGGGAGGR